MDSITAAPSQECLDLVDKEGIFTSKEEGKIQNRFWAN
jgi:hypothetical protein